MILSYLIGLYTLWFLGIWSFLALILLLIVFRQYIPPFLLGGILAFCTLPHEQNTYPHEIKGMVVNRVGVHGVSIHSSNGNFYMPKGDQYLGCFIHTKGHARKPYTKTHLGSFDERSWLKRHYLSMVWQSHTTDIIYCHKTLYQTLYQTIDQLIDSFSLNHPESIKALILGRSDHKPNFWYSMGIIHLLSISGMHINGIISLLKRLLRGTRLSHIPLLLCYQYIIFLDFSIPAYRAWLSVFIATYADYLPISTTVYDRYLLVLAIIASRDPNILMDMGAMFSFTAALTLLICRLNKIPYYLPLFFSIAMVSILFGLSIDPLSLLANIIVMPLFEYYIFPLILGAVIFIPLPFLAYPLLTIVDHTLNLISRWMLALSLTLNTRLVFPSIKIISISSWLILRYCLRFSNIFMLLLLIPNLETQIPKGHFQLHLFNCGHGLSVLITTKHHSMLYDIGSRRRQDIAHSTVIPYLNHHMIRKLDKVVISHPDWDHYSGLQSLLYTVAVDELISTIPLSLNTPISLKQSHCHPHTWEWDGVKFQILHPSDDKLWQGNNNSCVIKVTGFNGSLLLTGDIEKSAEAYLVDKYQDTLSSDILLIPHHGSKTSSHPKFLDTVNASRLLISEDPHKVPKHWQNNPKVLYPPQLLTI